MHYYKFNIADCQSSTRHLTPEEEGVYFRLINHYYDTEKPIPLETQPVIRRLMLGSSSELVDQILEEFFVKTERGYEKEKCNEIIKEYKKTQKKNKLNGAKGGRPAKNAGSKETQDKPSGLPVGTQTEPKHNPNQELLTINQEPLTSNQVEQEKKDTESKIPACNHQAVIGLYNQKFPELSQVMTSMWDGPRKKRLATIWKSNSAFRDLAFWEWYFDSIRLSDQWSFYSGNSERGWKADIEYFMRPKVMPKLIEKFNSEAANV